MRAVVGHEVRLPIWCNRFRVGSNRALLSASEVWVHHQHHSSASRAELADVDQTANFAFSGDDFPLYERLADDPPLVSPN
jgi:hypothetical protein